MRPLTAALVCSALFAVFDLHADAASAPAMSDFAADLSDRNDREDFGRDARLGRVFLPRAVELIERLTYAPDTWLESSSRRFLRAMPKSLRRLYPAEFRAGTPGDVSDLLDECLPAAADLWKSTLETRLAGLEGLLAMSEQCGHRGRPKQMAKLRKIVAQSRAAVVRADAAKTPAARYDRLIALDSMTVDDAAWRGLVPSNYDVEASSAVVRFGTRRVDAAGPIEYDPWGEAVPLGVDTTLEGGTLTVHAMFWFTDVQFRQQRDIEVRYDFNFVVEDAATAGRHAVTSASLLETTRIVPYDGEETWKERTLTLVDGTLDVVDMCDDRIAGTFVMRLRTESGATMTVRGDEIGVYLGP
jgi:hypothetical protein